MSNLKDILNPTPAGSSDFIASGTLPNGAPVVLKSDGTVVTAAPTVTQIAESIPAGSEYVFHEAAAELITVAFDPSDANKFVLTYAQQTVNVGHGTAIVGTISGTTISFGTAVVFNAADTLDISCSFDPNSVGKFVVAYRDPANSWYGTTKVGTVSGTTISFGTALVFNSSSTANISCSFDPNNVGKFVVAYRNSSNGNYGTAIVGTISGTSLSFGTAVVFNAGATFHPSRVDFDSNTAGKFVVVYRDGSNSYAGTAIVGALSGTTLTFGTAVAFNAGATELSSSFDSGKFVAVYKDGSNTYGTAVVGTVTGTTISLGTAVVFNAGVTSYTSVDLISSKCVIVYRDQGNSSRGTAVVGTISGTTISFGSELLFNVASTTLNHVAFDPNNSGKFVVVYKDVGNLNKGTAIVGQMATTVSTPNLTSTNFLGTSTAAYTNAQTATIMLQGGVSTNQTGLTIGSTYYVQPDGTLSTTIGSPKVEAGKALSATSLFLSDKPVVVGTADFIASGTLPNGAPVVLKEDGTVGVVAISPAVLGTAATISGAYFMNSASAFDPNNANKFVLVWPDSTNSNYGTAVVGTVSGTTISFGAKYVLSSYGASETLIAFDPNTSGRFVVSVRGYNAAWLHTAIVGDITGTAISFGATSASFAGSSTGALAFDPNNANKFVFTYRSSTGSEGFVVVGSIAGTAISWGTPLSVTTTNFVDPSLSFDPSVANSFIIVFRDGANSNYGTVRVGTISGTTITLGAKYVAVAKDGRGPIAAFDPNTSGSFAIAFSDNDSAKELKVLVGNVSGTTVTFGSEYLASAVVNTSGIKLSFNPNVANEFIVSFKDRAVGATQNYALYRVGTVAGTTVSFATVEIFNESNHQYPSLSFDPNTSNVLFTNRSYTTSGEAVILKLSEPNLTSTNFLGTSQAAYTDTQTASIMLQGSISTNQTGLTIGSTYYVQPDGTLTTSAGTPSVIAGKAISATSLFLSDPADPAVALNTAKVTNSTDASDLVSGTLADARFPATLPAISGANLTNLPAGGAWTYLSTINASASTVDFTFSSTYDDYMVVVNDWNGQYAGHDFLCRVKAGGAVLSGQVYAGNILGLNVGSGIVTSGLYFGTATNMYTSMKKDLITM